MLAGALELEFRAATAKLSKDLAEAKTMVGQTTKEIERLAGLARTALGLIGVGLSVGALKGMADGVLQFAAAVGHLTERVGGNAEAWSGVVAAFKAGNASFELLETSASRLARAMAGSEVETKGSSKAFEFLGVSVRDSLGNMRPVEQVMLDIAKAMAKYEDGAGKAAIAQDIFGKGGAAVLPALKELAERGDQVGKVTQKQAEEAIQYEKELRKLQGAKNDLIRTIVFGMLPAAQGLVDALVEMKKQSGGVSDAAKALAADGSLEEWAWNGAKAVAVLMDALAGAVQLFKTSKAALTLWMNDVIMEGLPFSEQLGSLARLTETGRKNWDEWTAAVAAARKKMAELGEENGKTLLTMVKLQEEAARALQGRTGPQFMDARDLAVNRPKLNANSYTSGEAKAVEDLNRAYNSMKKTLQELLLPERERTQVNKTIIELTNLSKKAQKEMTDEQRAELLVLADEVDGRAKEKKALENWITMQQQLKDMEQEQVDAYVAADKARENAVKSAQQYVESIQFETAALALSDDEREITIALRNLELSGLKVGTVEYDSMAASIIKSLTAYQQMRNEVAKHKTLAQDTANAWRSAGQIIQESLTKAFGEAGKAAGDMIQAYTSGTATAIEIDDKYTKLKQQRGADIEMLERKRVQDQTANTLQMYGDMAGAAAGFFGKQTAAYKVLTGIEQAMYAVRFAMQAQAMVQDLFFTSTSVANSGTRAAADGVAAVAKTMASVPFPYNIAAAAVVVGALVALGVRMSGGSSGSAMSAQEMQAKQGTGTVLGDSTAKSASIDESLKQIKDIDKLGLVYTHDMLNALLSIQNSMASLAAAIYRFTGTSGTGINEGSSHTLDPGLHALGLGGFDIQGKIFESLSKVDPLLNKVLNWIGSVSTKVTDTGLLLYGRLSEMVQGLKIEQYTMGTQTTSYLGGLFSSSSPVQVNTPVSQEVSRQVALIFKGITDSVEAAAKALGTWTPYFRDAMMNIILTTTSISFKDLKGQELQDAISSFFSAASDEIAQTMLPGFEAFQKAGEGYYQTVMRVASENELAVQSFAALGWQMTQTGMAAITARLNLVDLAGGADAFSKLVSGYYDKYYSDAEKHATMGAQLATEFAALGQAMPTSKAGFRSLIESIGTATPEAQALTIKLLQLADSFDTYASSVVGLDGKMHTLDDVTAQHASLEERYALASRTKTQQQIDREKEMAGAIDQYSVSMLRAIYLQEDNNAAQAAAQQRRRAEMALESQLLDAQGKHAEALALQRTLDIEGMDDAAIASYDYQQALRAQIAEQTKTNELQDAIAKTNVDLLRAQGNEQAAVAAQRALDIQGMTAEQVALYDLNQTMKAQITALNSKKDLETQLFNLTHNEAQQLERNRALRMAELAAQEQAAGLASGTLTSIQAQIDAQTDLNAAMDKFGITASGIAELLKKGLTGEITPEELGKQLGDLVVNGIQNALIGNTANQISQLVMDNLMTPIMTSIVQGATATAAVNASLTQANIDFIVGKATSMMQALTQIFSDPAFIAAMNSLRTTIQSITSTINPVVSSTANSGYQNFGSYYILNGVTYQNPHYNEPNASGSSTVDILSQRLEMLAKIYALTGDKAAAAAVLEQQHAIALAKLDPSLRDLQKQLWGLEDAAAAAAEAAKLAATKRDLEIQLMEATGDAEGALAARRADALAALDPSLRDLQQKVWAALDAQKLREATDAWTKQLTTWRDGLMLNTNLSPLTASQRFHEAQRQYVEDLLKAQGGDQGARDRFTSEAEAYLQEALAMFGRGSIQYQQIWQAIQEQTNGLIAQGLGGNKPATLGDVNDVLIQGQATAKQQADELIAEVRALRADLNKASKDSMDQSRDHQEQLVDTLESSTRATTNALTWAGGSGGLLR